MPDPGGEVLMLRAFLKLVLGSPEVIARKFSAVVMLEDAQLPTNPGPRDLILVGAPLSPDELPTTSANVGIMVDIAPVFFTEATTKNSSFPLTAELDFWRRLLHTNLPLVNPDDPAKFVSDDKVSVSYRGVDTAKNQRVPRIRAIYTDKINPENGERLA